MSDFTQPLLFPNVAGKEVVARFDGGEISSDAGVVLLAQADRKLGLVDAVVDQIADTRQAAKVRHPISDILRQRIFGIACGYEDANDFDTLASDPALKIACGRAPKSDADLASQPTISRLENRMGNKDLHCAAHEIARCVVKHLPRRTKRIVLDLDAYEDPCHGQQEFEFFNGHYGSHCYLPLAMFISAGDGPQLPMGAMLRSGKGGNAGVLGMIRSAVCVVRERFARAKIILRADAGFGNAQVLALCDELGISYCLGLSTNSRLQELSTRTQMWACWRYTFAKDAWAKAEGGGVCRVFSRFMYKAGSWKREHRVVVKAQITQGQLNPRYIVTNLSGLTPQKAYEFYCGRGDAENRIKEFKLDLFADRLSCHRFRANQFRLLLHLAAAVLVSAIKQAAKTTSYACAQAVTIRLRLLKVGARIVESTRRIWLHLASSYPSQAAWRTVHAALGP